MLRFYAQSYVATMNALSRHVMLMNPIATGAELREGLAQPLADAEAALSQLPISPVLIGTVGQLRKRVEEGTIAGDELGYVLKTLHDQVLADLAAPLFLCIPRGSRNFYTQPEPLFGDPVDRTFPEARTDLAAAGRCLALDEWTATIFHLMRVLEHGLRDLAGRLELGATGDLDQATWGTIIDRIESRIRELDAGPRSPEKTATASHYHGLAQQFRHFKDAWRNHVMHARTHYDQHEAWEVWTSVRAFMLRLAAPP